jgi:hypothetical protein
MTDGHLSDKDILLFLDLELPDEQVEAARQHLARCMDCELRLQRMETTLGDVNRYYASELAGADASASVSRARLRQNLLTQRRGGSWWHRPLSNELLPRFAAVAMLVAALAIVVYGRRSSAVSEVNASQAFESGSIPDKLLTPGAIRSVTLSEVCESTDDDLDPVVPVSIQHAVLEEYRVPRGRDEQNYQIDYLVNPQLGGTNDIKNLWPEPSQRGIWNARAKDELEKHLHQLVCNRTVDLNVAQREIATDWIAAYRKYLGRQTPA